MRYILMTALLLVSTLVIATPTSASGPEVCTPPTDNYDYVCYESGHVCTYSGGHQTSCTPAPKDLNPFEVKECPGQYNPGIGLYYNGVMVFCIH